MSQPPSYPNAPYGQYPQQQSRGSGGSGGSGGMPWWAWLLTIGFIACVLGCAGCFAGLIWIGNSGPATYVYSRVDLPPEYVQQARDDGLLEEGESIRYFYSDGLGDIDDGYYFVSDRKVGLFNSTWTPRQTAIPFESIMDVRLDRNTSFFEDSTMTVEDAENWYYFPVSSEKNLDEAFLEAIEEGIERAGGQATGGGNGGGL